MTLSEELAPSFWEELGEHGYTQEDLEANRIKNLGSQLCEFMRLHLQTEAEVDPVIQAAA
jgi:hypothetical protein